MKVFARYIKFFYVFVSYHFILTSHCLFDFNIISVM